jgi:hypothetical protein
LADDAVSDDNGGNNMTDNIINFEDMQIDLALAKIDDDDTHCFEVSDKLFEVMASSELSDSTLISSVIIALINTLKKVGGISRADAKTLIAETLSCYPATEMDQDLTAG